MCHSSCKTQPKQSLKYPQNFTRSTQPWHLTLSSRVLSIRGVSNRTASLCEPLLKPPTVTHFPLNNNICSKACLQKKCFCFNSETHLWGKSCLYTQAYSLWENRDQQSSRDAPNSDWGVGIYRDPSRIKLFWRQSCFQHLLFGGEKYF